ncbi:MAG: hypothetical protein LC798_03045 [Chloroflexi bacterium]|nr:hypothetical protein [Chloroflexota bacterium]
MAIRYRQEVSELDEVLDDDGRVQTAEGWAFRCSPPCGFVSSGWATKKAATERARQHAAEHETGEPMSELREFIAERGARVVMAEVKAGGE